MDPPRYRKAINISFLINIIILTSLKIVLDFNETFLSVSVYFDLFFNFIILASAMITIFIYKDDEKIIRTYIFLPSCACVFVTSIISGFSLLTGTELRSIFNFVAFSIPILGCITFIGISDDKEYD